MAQTRSVSFLLPAFNSEVFLPLAVKSILCGNLGEDDEIIIVDDASTDNTAEVALALSAQHPGLKVIRHRYQRGSAAAGRNTAIEHAKNDLFFALDVDNLLIPESVPRLADYLLSEGADAAAFQEVRFFSDEPKSSTHSWFFRDEVSLADAFSGNQWPGPDGNYLFTKESWLRAGRYDEFVGGGIDSWAFGIRQLVSGSRMVTLRNSHYLHRWGHDSAWVRDAKDGNQSLKAIRVVLPLLDLLDQESAEYLLSAEGRTQWLSNLRERPLRLRNTPQGRTGDVRWQSSSKERFFPRLRRFLAQKIAPV